MLELFGGLAMIVDHALGELRIGLRLLFPRELARLHYEHVADRDGLHEIRRRRRGHGLLCGGLRGIGGWRLRQNRPGREQTDAGGQKDFLYGRFHRMLQGFPDPDALRPGTRATNARSIAGVPRNADAIMIRYSRKISFASLNSSRILRHSGLPPTGPAR